jgi:hypothetical protein
MYDVFYSRKKPNCFSHEQYASSIEDAKILSRTEYFWWITYLSDYSAFDFLYVPKPWEKEYTHVWPSQHHNYSGTYLVPKHEKNIEYHFHKEILPNRESAEHYHQLAAAEFDYTWTPHPHDPPYIYVFGNQWWPAEVMPTVEYHVPGATERKYMTQPRAVLPERHDNRWCTREDCNWDYSWQPDPGDPPYIYVFGNQWWPSEKMPTVEYHVPGATERKYMSWPRAELLSSMEHWTVPDNLDVADFDFSWYPDPGAPPYIYQFATQHQKTGGPVYTAPGATEVKYLSDLRARTTRVATAVYEIDHMDGHAGKIPNVERQIRYFDNYRDTLIRLAKNISDEHEYVWVCSSICSYDGFDFSWHPEAWQSTMLHVFASNDQKFGDTFFMHVPTFAEYAEKKALLDWYDINYVPNISVPRRSMPVIHHTNDTHVEAVKTTDWAGPLAVFTVDCEPITLPTVSLWRQETKNIVPLSAGASAVIVPKTARADVRTQLYDYPFIDKSERKRHGDRPLDIVFIANGEPNAFDHWIRLINETGYRPNRVVQVANVNGRVAAYHAAASASQTPWFFAVFAKLEVDDRFDWSWQPDRMQEPKHYIFHARNPVNGLVYGHQAMIAYNRELVLNNPGHGLDFTLDSAHEVVPILSGVARYNVSPWVTWRTAFREALKLCSSPDVESQYRLKQWLATPRTNIENWGWSVWGAEDAVEYYQAVEGDFEALRKSYDWSWLASYALIRRNLTPDL